MSDILDVPLPRVVPVPSLGSTPRPRHHAWESSYDASVAPCHGEVPTAPSRYKEQPPPRSPQQ